MLQIWRVGNPHMRPEGCHWPMNQRPVSMNSSRQKCGVFVVRRHDDTVALKAAEVLGQRQRHSRAATRIRSVRHHVLLELGNERDTWILDTPDLLWIIFGTRHERRLRIDLPAVNTVS